MKRLIVIAILAAVMLTGCAHVKGLGDAADRIMFLPTPDLSVKTLAFSIRGYPVSRYYDRAADVYCWAIASSYGFGLSCLPASALGPEHQNLDALILEAPAVLP